MKKIFIPYTEAVALTKKGFNADCLAFYAIKYDQTYNGKYLTEPTIFISENATETAHIRKVIFDVFAPTWDQVIDWFKDKHQISIDITFINLPGVNWYGYAYDIRYTSKERPIPADFGTFTPRYETRYEALKEAIEAAIKVI